MTTTVGKTRAVKKMRNVGKREARKPSIVPSSMSAESLVKVKAYLARKGIPETPEAIREAWEESVLSHQAIEEYLAGNKGERVTLEEFHAFLEEE